MVIESRGWSLEFVVSAARRGYAPARESLTKTVSLIGLRGRLQPFGLVDRPARGVGAFGERRHEPTKTIHDVGPAVRSAAARRRGPEFGDGLEKEYVAGGNRQHVIDCPHEGARHHFERVGRECDVDAVWHPCWQRLARICNFEAHWMAELITQLPRELDRDGGKLEANEFQIWQAALQVQKITPAPAPEFGYGASGGDEGADSTFHSFDEEAPALARRRPDDLVVEQNEIGFRGFVEAVRASVYELVEPEAGGALERMGALGVVCRLNRRRVAPCRRRRIDETPRAGA